jgi:hypothetical protein
MRVMAMFLDPSRAQAFIGEYERLSSCVSRDLDIVDPTLFPAG